MNTFGTIFRLTTFGESHGEAIGGVVDGMPAGIDIDMDFIQQELNRRRPGQSKITTSRQEPDQVELLSGVFEGKSTGCPIGFIVRNTNQHSQDYENMRNVFRPSHADYTYFQKYGIRDHRGGGRSSARITISRCVGGALAKLVLKQLGISVQAYTSQVGNIALKRDYRLYDLSLTETNAVRCPDAEKAAEMEALITQVKGEGDTIEIVDFKSEDKPDLYAPENQTRIRNHRRQLEIYSHIVEEKFGKKVSRMHLYYTKVEDENPYISWDYKPESAEKTLSAFDQVVARIEAHQFSNVKVKKCKWLCGGCDMRFFCHYK